MCQSNIIKTVPKFAFYMKSVSLSFVKTYFELFHRGWNGEYSSCKRFLVTVRFRQLDKIFPVIILYV